MISNRRHRSAASKKEDRLPCKNARLGCKVMVREQDTAEHLEKCSFIFINCEACGQRVLLRDLFTHQKYKKCYEKKLRQEVIRSVRKTQSDVRQHQQQLMKESAHREMMKRWGFRIRLHEKTGYTPRVPSASECVLYSPSRLEAADLETMMTGGTTFMTESTVTGDEPMTESRTETSQTLRSSSYGNELRDDEDGDDLGLTLDLDGRSTKMSRAALERCQRCDKNFIHGANHDEACRYHRGPMLKVFGGMCRSCGRLDYQPGCMASAHEG